jgi:phage terminase large subunit-like protein
VTSTLHAEDAALAELAETLLAMPREQLVAYLDQAPAEKVTLCERALGQALSLGWRSTPTTMAHHLTTRDKRTPRRERVELWRYSKFLGDKFRQAVDGVSPLQIWNLPARYGKSLLGSRWGPVWAFDRDVLRAELRLDRQKQDRFVTTEGGGLLAAGILGGVTGFGAHGVVFDDPFKNWQEAHSQARRDLVDNTFRSVLSLRLEEESSWIIVIQTRWHEDDLSGRLVERMEDGTGEAWDLVRIPAIAEAPDPTSLDPLRRLPDPLDREPGEPIEPRRFSIAAVRARQRRLGSYLTAGMEQQRPAPEEGGEIKRAWWKVETSAPPRFDQAITSWDMKLKEKKTGDYQVGQAWGRTGSHFWLVEQLRGQWNMPTIKAAIALLSVRHPECTAHVIENTGNGPEVMEQLRSKDDDYELGDEIADDLGMTGDERERVEALIRRGIPGLLPENVRVDKVTRARAVSPVIEAGDVHVLATPGCMALIEEAAAFPNGTHDDAVDAMSQALKRLLKGTATATVMTDPISSGRPSQARAPIARGAGGIMLPRRPSGLR